MDASFLEIFFVDVASRICLRKIEWCKFDKRPQLAEKVSSYHNMKNRYN